MNPLFSTDPLRRFPRRRLGLHLAVTVAVAGLVISSLLAAVLLAIDYRTAVSSLDETFNRISEREAPEIARSVWTIDTDASAVSLRNLLTYNYLKAVELIENGNVRQSVGKADAGMIMREIPLSIESQGSQVSVGSLRVYADLASLRDSLFAIYGWRFASSLSILALVMGLTLWILDRQVTRHLRRVSHFVGQLTPETLDRQMNVARTRGPHDNDELDQLIDGIARMQSSLRQNIASLEHSLAQQREAEEAVRQLNATLESKVDERTRDLEQERERGNAVMALTRSGYFAREVTTGRIRLNDFARDLLDLPAQESYSLAEIYAVAAAASPAMATKFASWADENASSAADMDFEFPARHTNGRVVWLHIRRVADRRQEGLVYGAIQDVSDTIAAHQQLAEARDAAEAANSSKSEFLANMSHEIRTPLNGMLGMVQLLERSGLDARQAGYVGKLRFSADILLGVINDILDFSKIEAGQLSIEAVPFDLREVVSNAVTMIKTRADEKGLVVTLELDPELPGTLAGDPLRLSQVITNLGNNAVKFTHAGTITVRVRREFLEGDRVGVAFELEDTGIGMSQEETSRLFQAFGQADGSISRRFGGTGLGLAICKRLVEAMGGDIGVSSQVGVGSVFHFRLRYGLSAAVPSRTLTATSKVLRPAVSLRGLTIVLADDNPINRDVAGEMLTGAGARVITAEDGQQALAKIAQLQAAGQPVSIVLMDIQMPVMDGFTATAHLRAQPATAHLPIVAMTAHGLSGDRERSLTAGMNDHLAKPIAYDALLDMVLRWARPAANPPVPELQSSSAPAMAEFMLPDSDVIKPSEALPRMNNNQESYLRLLDIYIDQCAEFATEYRQAQRAEARADIAHRLKGSASTLGMPRVRALAASHETRQRSGASPSEMPISEADIDQLLEAVAQSCLAAAQLLQIAEDRTPATAVAPGKFSAAAQANAAPTLTALLREVREHLKRFSRPPTAMLADMLHACAARGKDVTTFKARLAAFDLAGANAALDAMFTEEST